MRDLIIDAFAGGGGASVGIEMALGRQVDIAINHDPDAILMHKTNHPDTLHLTEDIFKVDLKKYVKGRHVSLMWASPDCTHFSKAKGGKPLKQEIRMLPMAVVKHAKTVHPDVVIMENVEEIRQWGKLDKKGHPIPLKKGKLYQEFIKKMYLAGYTKIETRELVAADYGAPTTRKRWYAIFRRDGKEIVWPGQTHSKGGVNGLQPWEPIWKYLDLSDAGKSIFGRKKPLAKNTMNRIARGMEKFVFNNPEPFIMQIRHTGFTKDRNRSVEEPLSTIVTKNEHCLITPAVMPYMSRNNTGAPGSDVKDPMLTITTGGHHGIISPLLIQYHSETTKSGGRGQSVAEPIRTIDTSNRYGLVMSYMTKFYKSGCGQSLLEPIHTITTSPGHFGTVSVLALPVEELLKSLDNNAKAQNEVNDVIQKCTWVSQFIMEYYGCGIGQNLNDPLHTIVTKDRFALITVLGNEYAIIDIFLRMLKPEELKLGQGFPVDYVIDHDYTGKKYPVSKQVARIGNSVVPIVAQKLVGANCPYLKIGERQPVLQMKHAIQDDNGQLRFA